MAYIDPKRDYKDGEILYGIDLSASNEVIKAGVDDNFDRIRGLQNTKQDVINESNKLDYSLLDNTPDIPEKTSDLDNDSGFIDDSYHDASKQDVLQSGTNIKTINNESILGEGNLVVEGIGTTDYDELENQPQVNGVTLVGNKSLNDLGIDIPTKMSELTNDNNTVTDASYVHTDSNYTSAEKTKLATVEAGAQANVTEVVVDDTPTADTQIIIDGYDLDPNVPDSEITDEYSDSPLLGYSSHYSNNNFVSKTGNETVGTLHQNDYPTTLPSGDGTSPSYWCSLPNGTYWHKANDNVTNMPSNYGFIIKDGQTDGTQKDFNVLFFKQDTGSIYRTSGNNSTATCVWLELAYKDDLDSYLPLIGGILSGNLEIGNNTDTNDKSLRIINSNQDTYFIIKSDGRIGIWSNTLNRYILLEDTSGNLNLNNNKITIEDSGIVDLTNDLRYDGGNNNSYIYIGNKTANKIKEYQTENSSIKVGSGTDANGAYRIYDYTHSKDILRDTAAGVITFNGKANQATQDGDGNNIPNTYLKKKNVAIGSVSITPSGANSPTQKAVTWPEMDGVPTVVVTPNVGAGLDQNIICGYTGASKTGCTLWIKSNNTTARTLSYIAIYK